ncbi:MAG: hypothetical protein BA874_02190 [Desulfuromonadales bacterium C00003068]|jgi:hypothetical protein|nr:MAG: hypothetical protein BA874_02190 [Desulfuromonadales bacterium C00003068]
MVDWSQFTAQDESIVWQARPAPRCFTFRRWQHALFGVLVTAMSIWWLVTGWGLVEQGEHTLWAVVPVPFLVIGLYLSVGQLLMARLEWERVFYALTERQLLVQCGLLRSRIIAFDLKTLSYQCLYPLGEQLGTFYLEAGTRRITLSCIEYPHELYRRLEPWITENNANRSE